MAPPATPRYTRRNTHYPTTTAAARPWCAGCPPRPPPVRRSMAQWEKDFIESRGVPRKKTTDVGFNVERWDDSGAVQALLAAKRRYWAEINGGLAAPPLPDPDMYIDKVDDEDGCGSLDPELCAEYEAALRAMEIAWEENAKREMTIVSWTMLPDDFVPVATGWI